MNEKTIIMPTDHTGYPLKEDTKQYEIRPGKIIAMGSDHAGYAIKEKIRQYLEASGFIVQDFGTDSEASVDYPDFIHPLASALQHGEFTRGIIVCGSGNGVSMVANKYTGIRAALCWAPELAQMARLHNDANILALPGRYISEEDAIECVNLFLSTAFEGGRHQLRVDKINIRDDG
jgi:ribose 5-phosphate isomerase B